MHPEARWGVDEYDDFSAPRLPGYVELVSEHEEFFLPQLRRDVVGWGDEAVWDWQVEGPADTEVVIDWDVEKVRGLEEDLWLVDRLGVQGVKMSEEGSYRVRTDSQGRYGLQVVYGELVGEGSAGWQVGLLYPNPARGWVEVPVRVSGESRVRLEVVDVTGRVVAEQQYGGLSAGYHRLRWRRADAPHPIPNGIYLMRISGQTTVSRRIAIE